MAKRPWQNGRGKTAMAKRPWIEFLDRSMAALANLQVVGRAAGRGHLPPPALIPPPGEGSAAPPRHADWDDAVITPSAATVEDPANAGIPRRRSNRRNQEQPSNESNINDELTYCYENNSG
jgi:hypothetical protein